MMNDFYGVCDKFDHSDPLHLIATKSTKVFNLKTFSREHEGIKFSVRAVDQDSASEKLSNLINNFCGGSCV